MTFTIRDGVCRCDTCDQVVTNTWRAKQGHVCATSPQNNERSDQT